jgi:hypothetical protein
LNRDVVGRRDPVDAFAVKIAADLAAHEREYGIFAGTSSQGDGTNEGGFDKCQFHVSHSIT